jgi:hypothetical protein
MKNATIKFLLAQNLTRAKSAGALALQLCCSAPIWALSPLPAAAGLQGWCKRG